MAGEGRRTIDRAHKFINVTSAHGTAGGGDFHSCGAISLLWFRKLFSVCLHSYSLLFFCCFCGNFLSGKQALCLVVDLSDWFLALAGMAVPYAVLRL